MMRGFGGQPRFVLSALLFIAGVIVCLASGFDLARSIVYAFAIAAVAFLAAIVHLFARTEGSESIRTRARTEDPGRRVRLWSGVSVSIVTLVALGLELRAGRNGGLLDLATCAAALLLSWLFMNTLFALHYAHQFYGDDARRQRRGGLEFPGRDDPDYWDFVYFAIVIGMTFQVSDVQITNRTIRRTVLVHGLVAFAFNVVIIALSVNVVAGRL
jgi:uncharacterized membrane protein